MTGLGRAVWICALSAASGCREPRAEPPPAPAMDRPALAIPADLDVALRLDLVKARRAFGPRITESLGLDVVDRERDPGTASLLAFALEHASALWIGFRPGSSAPLTDNVIVLRGSFSAFDPLMEARSGFSHPADLGGGVLLYERPKVPRRSAPVRIYAFGDERLVFVSEAEVDSAERTLEGRSPGDPVKLEEGGLASFAARPRHLSALLSPDFPAVAEVVGSAESLRGSMDLGDEGLRGTLEARFAEKDRAALAGGHTTALLQGLAGGRGILARLARGARTEVVGPSIVVRVSLDGPATEGVLLCLQGGASC